MWASGQAAELRTHVSGGGAQAGGRGICADSCPLEGPGGNAGAAAEGLGSSRMFQEPPKVSE